MLWEKYGIYRIYTNSGDAVIRVEDIVDDTLQFEIVNNRQYDQEELIDKVNFAINSYIGVYDEDWIYSFCPEPVGYGR